MTTTVRHLSCGWLHAPPNPRACCHCLLLADPAGLALVDTGIGLRDIADPFGRIGQPAIDAAGFQFRWADTAARQLEQLGHAPAAVTDVVLTHADTDHVGGLADFPGARVHLSAEEHAQIVAGYPRFSAAQFAHGPRWQPAPPEPARDWFGLPARPVPLGFAAEVLLVPLPGHTLGHCGVAVRQGGRWLLHVGDAYYLRAELTTDDHPGSALAAMRAQDDGQRRASLEQLRRLHRDHAGEVELFGYHDTGELPASP
jgi:glyoxylase-like metal-dependent hydrolase (beta-lactamase superfamily II)